MSTLEQIQALHEDIKAIQQQAIVLANRANNDVTYYTQKGVISESVTILYGLYHLIEKKPETDELAKKYLTYELNMLKEYRKDLVEIAEEIDTGGMKRFFRYMGKIDLLDEAIARYKQVIGLK